MEMEKEEDVEWQQELEEASLALKGRSRFPNGDPQSNGAEARDDVINGAGQEAIDSRNESSSSVYYDPNEGTRLNSTHSADDHVGVIPGSGILEIGSGDVSVPKNFVSILGNLEEGNKKGPNSLTLQQSEIVSEKEKNEDVDLIDGGGLEETEVDLEKVIQKQNTHDLFCPNCNSCITKRVILRKRKRGARIPNEDIKRNKLKEAVVDSSIPRSHGLETDNQADNSADTHSNGTRELVGNENDRDVFRCLSCFSFFIPTGNGFKIFRGFGNKDQQRPMSKNLLSSIFGSREEPISEPGDIAKEAVNDSQASTSNIPIPVVLHDHNSTSEASADRSPEIKGNIPENIVPASQTITSNIAKDAPTGHLNGALEALPDVIPVINGKLPENVVQSSQTSTLNILGDAPNGHQSGTPEASTDRDPVNGKSPENVVSIPPDGLKLLIASNGSSPITGQNPDLMMQNSDKGGPDSVDNSQLTSVSDGIYAGQLLTNRDPLVLSAKDVQFVQGGQVNMIKDLGKVSENLTEGRDTIIVVEPGAVCETASRPSENLNVSEETGALTTTSLIPSVSAYEQGRADGRESYRVDIIKSIVYGGLVESIASLGIVSAAAGGGSGALNIVTLSLANLMGGLVLIFHNLWDLKKDKLSEQQRRRKLPDRYEELLGQREGFLLHATVAMISFLVFGLIPPVTYGLSFRKSYSSTPELKIFATAAAAFWSILVLAAGKAYVQRAPKPYLKTVAYFIIMGFLVSGVSYGAGKLLDGLLQDKLHFRSNSDVALQQTTTKSTTVDWASY